MIVVPRHIAVIALVKPKESQQMRRHFVCHRAGLALSEQQIKVVCFAQDSALPDVECLGEGFQM